jgi:hypothetical protein
MRTATALTLVALGAILTFAVKAHPSFLNLQITGVVIMLVGVAGLALHRQGWLRRRFVVRKGANGPVVGHVDEDNFDTSYALIDPAALQSVQPVPDGEEHGQHPIPDVVEQIDESALTGEDGRSPSTEPLVMEETGEE